MSCTRFSNIDLAPPPLLLRILPRLCHSFYAVAKSGSNGVEEVGLAYSGAEVCNDVRVALRSLLHPGSGKNCRLHYTKERTDNNGPSAQATRQDETICPPSRRPKELPDEAHRHSAWRFSSSSLQKAHHRQVSARHFSSISHS